MIHIRLRIFLFKESDKRTFDMIFIFDGENNLFMCYDLLAYQHSHDNKNHSQVDETQNEHKKNVRVQPPDKNNGKWNQFAFLKG
ncbi:unnamed protein product [Didymodactylos carnosus]|uniref:Uncharacterized protein n=1 Tax=Didymodactylos carnosus TaxID=1234261 RepID=A0A815JR70_9BILA|nr:unnamed protein product [Didymodactylos carnosus]CAF1385536.1 unnamed protein product [Didymodactylos carnosus]CAF3956799.1 unnamed protein product [Didymodactylos carnosus]CAF4280592.1 unnamed protein product [Didymodactylos carnosus]